MCVREREKFLDGRSGDEEIPFPTTDRSVNSTEKQTMRLRLICQRGIREYVQRFRPRDYVGFANDTRMIDKGTFQSWPRIAGKFASVQTVSPDAEVVQR